ncbi:MAG: hypothetical protein CL600_05075 [Alteromonas sp.]|nr:hypothetical protein [Alteromonas sp.]
MLITVFTIYMPVKPHHILSYKKTNLIKLKHKLTNLQFLKTPPISLLFCETRQPIFILGISN